MVLQLNWLHSMQKSGYFLDDFQQFCHKRWKSCRCWLPAFWVVIRLLASVVWITKHSSRLVFLLFFYLCWSERGHKGTCGPSHTEAKTWLRSCEMFNVVVAQNCACHVVLPAAKYSLRRRIFRSFATRSKQGLNGRGVSVVLPGPKTQGWEHSINIAGHVNARSMFSVPCRWVVAVCVRIRSKWPKWG